MLRIGESIKRLRIKKGISQKKLAKLAGMTASYLSLLERDLREPSLSAVRRLATELAVPEEVLYWDAVSLPPDLTTEDREICEAAKMLVRRFYEGVNANPPDTQPEAKDIRRKPK